MDVGLKSPRILTHPLEFNQQRAPTRKPEEAVRKPRPPLHIQLQALNPELVEDSLAGSVLDSALEHDHLQVAGSYHKDAGCCPDPGT